MLSTALPKVTFACIDAHACLLNILAVSLVYPARFYHCKTACTHSFQTDSNTLRADEQKTASSPYRLNIMANSSFQTSGPL